MFGKRGPSNSDADKADEAVKRRAAEALERARAERSKSAAQPHGPIAAEQPAQAKSYTAPNSYAAPSSYTAPSSYSGPGRAQPALPGARPQGEGRTLVVGRDISLSGEIKACEHLIVEGQVSAHLEDCKLLQVSASGLFKGAAGVDRAEVSGRFEGDLTVRGTLVLRATGRVSGSLRYGDMEIERGGKIVGTLEEFPPAGDAAPGSASDSAKDRPKAAGKTRPAGSAARGKDRRARTPHSPPPTAR